jgi:hypothetical protein
MKSIIFKEMSKPIMVSKPKHIVIRRFTPEDSYPTLNLRAIGGEYSFLASPIKIGEPFSIPANSFFYFSNVGEVEVEVFYELT